MFIPVILALVVDPVTQCRGQAADLHGARRAARDSAGRQRGLSRAAHGATLEAAKGQGHCYGRGLVCRTSVAGQLPAVLHSDDGQAGAYPRDGDVGTAIDAVGTLAFAEVIGKEALLSALRRYDHTGL